MKHIDVIGKRFDRLLIQSESHIRDTSGRSKIILSCICDCGERTTVHKDRVLRGHTKSCGCLQNETRKLWGESQALSYGEATANETYASYKKSAGVRGFTFDLTLDEFIAIITKQCLYCGDYLTNEKRGRYKNGSFRYTGIDRYNNSLGYVKGNCVPCCRVCNRIKTDMGVDELEIRLRKMLDNLNIWKRTA